MITPAAIREISKLQTQVDSLLSYRHDLSRSDQKKADLLISKISAIRQAGMSTDEMRRHLATEIGREIGAPETDFGSQEQRKHEELFREFLSGRDIPEEKRATTFITGTQVPVFTSGSTGGFVVPISFYEKAAEARAAFDPLLNPEIVTLIEEPTFKCPPLSIPGWDLSTISATISTEASQHNTDTIPDMNTAMLNQFVYRLQLTASLEFENDAKAYGGADAALARAIGVGMARGIGKNLVTGDGTTAHQGILTGAANSTITTANAGKFVLEDFTSIYFSVNKAYRDSAKCGWLMADATYKQVLNSKDSNNRPLFPLKNDELRILGKPVLVAPSMPSGAGSKGIVFGDLGMFHVHSSTILLRRLINTPGLIEYGKCAYLALQMIDSAVDDPSNGSNAGIVYATLHS